MTSSQLMRVIDQIERAKEKFEATVRDILAGANTSERALAKRMSSDWSTRKRRAAAIKANRARWAKHRKSKRAPSKVSRKRTHTAQDALAFIGDGQVTAKALSDRLGYKSPRTVYTLIETLLKRGLVRKIVRTDQRAGNGKPVTYYASASQQEKSA